MESHSVTCYIRHKWTHPALTPAMQAGTRFTYPGGMEGWVDLVLDSAPAGSRTSDLSITRPTLNQCNHQESRTNKSLFSNHSYKKLAQFSSVELLCKWMQLIYRQLYHGIYTLGTDPILLYSSCCFSWGYALHALQKAQCSAVSNRIRVKFGRIVLQVNAHRLTEPDLWFVVVITHSGWQPWRHFTQISAATWWVNIKRLPASMEQRPTKFLIYSAFVLVENRYFAHLYWCGICCCSWYWSMDADANSDTRSIN